MTARQAQWHRRDADFQSRGSRCAAWMYRPAAAEDPPVVIMAHGFGGERDWRLPAFAERFAGRGVAVLLFDYCRFGDSGGQPRNLITPTGHVRDWQAAIEHVRGLDDVDGNRLALWGTSFSGGHALTTAARDGDVDAIVAQVPFSDGIGTVRHHVRSGPGGFLGRTVGAALRDLARMATRRSPYYIPIAAKPDEFALLNRLGALDGIESINGGEWDNRCAARILTSILGYRPITGVDQIDCPTLVVEMDADDIVPGHTVERLVNRLDDVEHVQYPAGHWDVHTGETFERVVEREATFLERHLVE